MPAGPAAETDSNWWVHAPVPPSLIVMMQVYSSVIQLPAGLIPSFPEATSLTVYHDWLLPSLCCFHTPLWGVPGVTSQIRHLPLGPGSAQHLDPMQHSGYVCTARSWTCTLAWVYNFPRAAIPNITDVGSNDRGASSQSSGAGGQDQVWAGLVPSEAVREAQLRPLPWHPWCLSNLLIDASLPHLHIVFSLCVCVQISPFLIRTKQLLQQID